ncbi:MAG TPA: helix-turn-helix domain-containing protein [Gemmata sp.]|jgi:hypothetical protein|nr:helix-turn-helix domain-containing protein [Gemmata sp.]
MRTKKPRKARPSKKVELNGTPPSSGGEIMTLSEAAGFLKVPEDGLKVEVANGKVPGRLVGGEWRFSRVALMCWLGHIETKSFPAGFAGISLVEHIRKTGVPWNPASESEAEAFIDAMKASSFSK